MKKFLFYTTLILIVIGCLSSCRKEDKQEIQTIENPVLTQNDDYPGMQYGDDKRISQTDVIYDTGFPEGDGFLHNLNIVAGSNYKQITEGLKTSDPTIYLNVNLFCTERECFRSGVYKVGKGHAPGTLDDVVMRYYPKGTASAQLITDSIVSGTMSVSKTGDDIYTIDGEFYTAKGKKLNFTSVGPLYAVNKK